MKKHSPKAIQAAFGAVMRKHRIAAGISQMRLADLAHMHFTYVSDIERGTRNVGIVNAVRLVAALQIPLDQFFMDVRAVLEKK